MTHHNNISDFECDVQASSKHPAPTPCRQHQLSVSTLGAAIDCARGSRTPMPVPLRLNQRWSLDVLSGTFGAVRKLRILAVNDDCYRENLYVQSDTP